MSRWFVSGLQFLVVSALVACGHDCFAQNNSLETLAADIDLTEDNYELWRKHLLPNEKELGWEKIPWLTTFKDGIIAADNEQKPLLLWTMNGHPLGCT